MLAVVLAGAILAGCAQGTQQKTRGEPTSTPATEPTGSVQGSTLATGPTEPGAPEGWGLKASWVLPWKPGAEAPRFVDKVTNPYWPLEPGTRWTYEAKVEDGTETIEVAVLSETKDIMGATCAVVRDTVRLDGELVEDTYDWYAQDQYGNVWYMGEDTKEYEGGKVVSTAGTWVAGVNGALPGIKVWAHPHVGQPAYYQEYFLGEAEDLGKDLSAEGQATVAFGTYDNLLVVEEWTPLDPEPVERKYYRQGIGTVKEEMIRGGNEVVELTSFQSP
jgi:hypothetical protein